MSSPLLLDRQSRSRRKLTFVCIVAVMALGLVSGLESAEAEQTVRWEDAVGSKGVSGDGIVFKRLIVDEIEIRASLSDLGHTFALELEIVNAAANELRVGEGLATLHSMRPHARVIRRVSAPDVAAQVRAAANNRASAIEAHGAMAVTTRPEAVPVTEVSPNPAAAVDSGQPATIVTMNTEIVMKTVPDDAERMRAIAEGSSIRREAEREATAIVNRAMRHGRLGPGAGMAGAIYFGGERKISELLVRIALPRRDLEIPFTATTRGAVLGPRRLLFR